MRPLRKFCVFDNFYQNALIAGNCNISNNSDTGIDITFDENTKNNNDEEINYNKSDLSLERS